MKIQAAVLRQAGTPLVIEEVELRDPLPGEVVVKLRASGICHTDLSVANGALPLPLPIILGHEGAGVVVGVGEGVTSVAKGDHVVLNNIPECGKCPQCKSPHTNVCVESGFAHQTTPFPLYNPNYTAYYKRDGEEIRTMFTAGTFATHTIVNGNSLTYIPYPDFPMDEAALLGCGVLTGIGCTQYATKVTPGSTVAVFGMGSIGLNVVQGAKLGGATTIIAFDILDSKEALARQFGATHFFNTTKLTGEHPLRELVTKITGGSLYVDFAIEATGVTKVLADAVGLVHPYWGVVIAVGIPHHTSEIKLPGPSLALGRTIKGVYLGNAKPRTAVTQIMAWYREKKIQIKPLITHRINLKDINKGLELLATGEPIRVVIEYNE